MPKQSINTLKNWFKRGLKPLEVQFADWLDSYLHKDATDIPISAIQNLSSILNGFASNEAILALLDDVPEPGNTLNKLYELIESIDVEPQVRATPLTGLSVSGGVVVEGDTVLVAFGKLQNQMNDRVSLSGSYADPSWITSLAASKLTGIVPLANLPAAALERIYVYTGSETLPENAGLTTSEVQNGDIVKMNTDGSTPNGLMYVVADEDNLDQAASFVQYSAGIAASVPWSGVTGTPTTLAGYGITSPLPIAEGGTGSATFPGWSLSTGAAITGVNTITSNVANQLLFNGTWTASANNQYHAQFAGTLTATATASDVLYGYRFTPSLTSGGSNQQGVAVDISPMLGGSFGTLHALRVTGRVALVNTAISLSGVMNAFTVYGVGTTTNNTILLGSGGGLTTMFVRDDGITQHTVRGSNGIYGWSLTTSSLVASSDEQTLFQILGTFTSSSTSGRTLLTSQLKGTMVTGSTGQSLISTDVSTTYTVNHTTGTIIGYRYNPTVGGSQTASHHKAWYHTAGYVQWDSDITPAQITSDQNNYTATGDYAASIFRFSTDAPRNMTGIVGGADGRIAIDIMVGGSLTYKHDTTSTASNRFLNSGSADFTAVENDIILRLYDATASRWRVAKLGGSGNGDVTGPGSATDNAIPRFDSTTGKLVKDSSVLIDNDGNIHTPGRINSSSVFGFGVKNAAGGYVQDIDWSNTSVANGGSVNAAFNIFQDFDTGTELEDRSALVRYTILLTKSDGSDVSTFVYTVAYKKDGSADPVLEGTAALITSKGNATPTISFNISGGGLPQVVVNDNSSGGWKVQIFAKVHMSN